MALVTLTQTSSGSAFKIDDSDIIKFYSRGIQTVIEYVAGENGIRKVMDVDESTTTLEGSSTKIITTSIDGLYLFLNAEKVLAVNEINSLAVITYDDAGSEPETLKLDVTEAVFLASMPSEAPAGYKIYAAFLNQTSTNAPTATILENTLGGDIVWTYNSVGQYVGTLVGAFTTNRTVCIPPTNWGTGNDDGITSSLVFGMGVNSEDSVYVNAGQADAAGKMAWKNGIMYTGYSYIEIRVYD